MKRLLIVFLVIVTLPAHPQQKGPENKPLNSFWMSFQQAVAGKQKEKVAEMTNFPFYDASLGGSYKNKTTFLKYYKDIMNSDREWMVKHAKVGQATNSPKRPNEYETKYDDGATIQFKEVTDQSLLATYRTKLKLSKRAKVYKIDYSFDLVLETSSHSSQSVTEYLYFGETSNGIKLCGKGMIF